MIATVPGREGLSEHGIPSVRGRIHWRPTTSQLYMHALARGDGAIAEGGPLVVDTGVHTGRSPNDKFIVREPGSEDRIWWSHVNADISEDSFERLRDKVSDHLGQSDVYVVDAFAGADPEYRIAVRVITESPWHALFAKTLFIDPTPEELEQMELEALVLHAPSLSGRSRGGRHAQRDVHRSPPDPLGGADRGHLLRGRDQEVDLHADERPASARGRLPDALLREPGRRRHGRGLLRALRAPARPRSPPTRERHLIGDDEHGWGSDGVFNIEGGCYAKVIRLSEEAEPEIYGTTRAYGTVLENVVMDEHGVLDLDDGSKTENTRAAYKLEQIANALPSKRGGAPTHGRLPHRGRVRDPPAPRQARPRPGALLVPLRVHGEARRHRDRRAGATADLLPLLRGAVPPAAAIGLCAACSESGSIAMGRRSGSSTRGGRAGRTERGIACRSRRRVRSCRRR